MTQEQRNTAVHPSQRHMEHRPSLNVRDSQRDTHGSTLRRDGNQLSGPPLTDSRARQPHMHARLAHGSQHTERG